MRQRFGRKISSGILHNKLKRVLMTLRSTEWLVGSELYQAGDWSKVCMEWSLPSPVPLDNMGSLFFKVSVEREDWRWWVELVFFCKSGFLNVVMWLFVDVLRPFMIKDLYRKMWVIFESEICFHHNIQKHASLLKRMLTCIVKDTFCTRVVKHYRDTVKESGLQEMWEKPNMHVESNVSRYLVCQKMVLEVIFPLPRWCSGEL